MRSTNEDGENDKDNGCYTYAWLAAEEVGADINVIARSGIGMIYSYDSDYFMSEAYKQTYCAETDKFNYQLNPDWDFSKYIPDIVIINVGTNDVCKPDYQEEDYINALTTLCEELIDKYGNDVEFLFCYGMMTSEYQDEMEIVSNKFDNVTLLKLPHTTTGGGNHPLANEHAWAAKILANTLRKYL